MGAQMNNGIADYLDMFEKSPYSYPANDRKSVSGVSKLKGSWKKDDSEK